MRPDDLLQVLRQQPFRPIRIHVTTGIVHEVRHSELALVGRSTVTLEFPPLNSPIPLGQRKIIIALVHIVQIEIVEAPPSPTNN
jgi:hypothetical protein